MVLNNYKNYNIIVAYIILLNHSTGLSSYFRSQSFLVFKYSTKSLKNSLVNVKITYLYYKRLLKYKKGGSIKNPKLTWAADTAKCKNVFPLASWKSASAPLRNNSRAESRWTRFPSTVFNGSILFSNTLLRFRRYLNF